MIFEANNGPTCERRMSDNETWGDECDMEANQQTSEC